MYGQQALSDEDKSRKEHSINMQLSILDSDQKKFEVEKNSLDAEIRKLKTEGERLRLDLDEKKKRLDEITYKFSQNEAEIKRLKRKLTEL